MVETVLRGRLKRERRTGSRVVAGDRVEVAGHADGSATIEAVAERESELARRAPGGVRRAKIIAANVDQVVAVFAAARPEPNLRMLDRFLVLAESNGLDVAVVVNKMDLVSGADARERFATYERIGYPVVYASAEEGEGVAALRERLCGRISVLTGPSGAGKSSLLNRIQPGLQLRVGTVRETAGKGRHTTVATTLLPLECGGYVADTPGLREIGFWGVDAAELDLYFPEFRPYVAQCRFGASCTHIHEPGCGVLEAVEAGEISRDRHDSYRAIHESEQEAAERARP